MAKSKSSSPGMFTAKGMTARRRARAATAQRRAAAKPPPPPFDGGAWIDASMTPPPRAAASQPPPPPPTPRVRRPRSNGRSNGHRVVPTSGPVAVSTGRQIIKIHRSDTVGSIPTGLEPGELAIEYGSDPPIMWVGVETAVDPSGIKLLGGGAITISDTPPSSPAAGDGWWDSISGQLFIYYTDLTSSQWVLANVPEPGPPGPEGDQGEPSWSPTVAGFTVPAIGDTVTVTVENAEWAVPGAFVNIGEMIAQVVSVSGDDVTLERVEAPQGEIGPIGPQGVQGATGATGATGADGADGADAQWVRLTQAEFNALSPPDPAVLYVIVG